MELYDAIHDFLVDIPATFWGVIVGSFFSLAGVVISNRANDKRLMRQLEHDRQLKAKERELSVKKEVYLAAAEAISAGITMIGTYSNLDKSPDEVMSNYSPKAPAIYKVHVIAEADTLNALVDLNAELVAGILQLSARRNVLLNLKREIDDLEEKRQSSIAELNRYRSLIDQQNIEGVTDNRKWEVLQDYYKDEKERFFQITTEKTALVARLRQDHFPFAKACTQEALKINKLLVPLVLAIRRELELPVHKERYMAIADQNLKRMEQEFSKFVGPIEASLAAEEAVAEA